MASIEKAYELLNKGEKKYTKEEARHIRDILDGLAQIALEISKNQNETNFTR